MTHMANRRYPLPNTSNKLRPLKIRTKSKYIMRMMLWNNIGRTTSPFLIPNLLHLPHGNPFSSKLPLSTSQHQTFTFSSTQTKFCLFLQTHCFISKKESNFISKTTIPSFIDFLVHSCSTGSCSFSYHLST